MIHSVGANEKGPMSEANNDGASLANVVSHGVRFDSHSASSVDGGCELVRLGTESGGSTNA